MIAITHYLKYFNYIKQPFSCTKAPLWKPVSFTGYFLCKIFMSLWLQRKIYIRYFAVFKKSGKNNKKLINWFNHTMFVNAEIKKTRFPFKKFAERYFFLLYLPAIIKLSFEFRRITPSMVVLLLKQLVNNRSKFLVKSHA